MASAACNHLSQRLIDSSLCPRGPAVTAQRHTLINTLHTIVPCKLEFSRKAVHLPTYACLQDITWFVTGHALRAARRRSLSSPGSRPRTVLTKSPWWTWHGDFVSSIPTYAWAPATNAEAAGKDQGPSGIHSLRSVLQISLRYAALESEW